MLRYLVLTILPIVLLVDCFGQDNADILLRRILERHVEACGGDRNLDALGSISIEGVQIQGATTSEFLLQKKRPNMIRYRVPFGENSITCGYNGQLAWERIEVGDEVTITELGPNEMEMLQTEVEFDSPLVRYLRGEKLEVTFIGNQRVEDLNTYALSVVRQDGTAQNYYLDTRNSYLVKLEHLDANGAVTMETFYRDYRIVDVYAFAFEIENRIGNETVSLVKVDSITPNAGILSFYFDKPLG